MSQLPQADQCGNLEHVWRSAACLGALGYSPHEVQCIIAAELHVASSVVADALRQAADPVPTAA